MSYDETLDQIFLLATMPEELTSNEPDDFDLPSFEYSAGRKIIEGQG